MESTGIPVDAFGRLQVALTITMSRLTVCSTLPQHIATRCLSTNEDGHTMLRVNVVMSKKTSVRVRLLVTRKVSEQLSTDGNSVLVEPSLKKKT